MFLILLFLLLFLNIYLWRRLRHLASSGVAAVGVAFGKIKKIFAKTEKEINKDIDKTVSDYELSKSSVEEAKRKLKDEIHKEIEKGEEEIDDKQ